MKTPGQRQRLQLESDLVERAWSVLEDSKALIQERQAQAAKLKDLLKRRDDIAFETLGDNR